VGLIGDRIAVAGLGPARESSELFRGHGKDAAVWQWLTTDYGQHLLIKRRASLSELPPGSRPRVRAPAATEIREPGEQAPLFTADEEHFPDDPENGIALLAARRYDPVLMSRLLQHYALQGSMPAAVFAALLSERLRERAGFRRSANGGLTEPGRSPRIDG
jgi:hypothetical protein